MESDSSTSDAGSVIINLNMVFETDSSDTEINQGIDQQLPEQSTNGNSSPDVSYDPLEQSYTSSNVSSDNPHAQATSSSDNNSNTDNTLTLKEYVDDNAPGDAVDDNAPGGAVDDNAPGGAVGNNQDLYSGEHHKFISMQQFDQCRPCRWLRRAKLTYNRCKSCRVHVCCRAHMQIYHNHFGNPELQPPPIASRTRFQRSGQNRDNQPYASTSDEEQGIRDLARSQRRGILHRREDGTSSSSSEDGPRTRRRRIDQAGPSNEPQHRAGPSNEPQHRAGPSNEPQHRESSNSE